MPCKRMVRKERLRRIVALWGPEGESRLWTCLTWTFVVTGPGPPTSLRSGLPIWKATVQVSALYKWPMYRNMALFVPLSLCGPNR